MDQFNQVVVFLLIGSAWISNAETDCFIRGECQGGTLVGQSIIRDKVQCLNFCKGLDDCTDFTWFKSDGLCLAFQDCPKLDKRCSDCESGSSTCSGTFKCWISGECKGKLLDHEKTCSEDECLRKCQKDPLCQWFSYHMKDGYCFTMESCENVTGVCDLTNDQGYWISGENDCKSFEDDTILAVGFGVIKANDYPNQFDQTVELVPIPECSPTKTCQTPVDFPETTYGAIVTVADDKILACGGFPFQANCYQLDITDSIATWTQLEGLPSPRYATASVETPFGFWVTGGRAQAAILDETVVYFNSQWQVGPALQQELYSHCVADMDNDNYLFIGGCTKFDCPIKSVASYHMKNIQQGEWKDQNPMSEGRYAFGCSKYFDITDNKNKIIVAGGYGTNQHLLKSVEIFSDGVWTQGTDLPEALTGLSMTTRNGLPIVLGGLNDDNVVRDKIYQLVDNCWIQLGSRLPTPKADGVVMKLPLDKLYGCKAAADNPSFQKLF